ncbi:nuclear transport factor 2 family protein [Nocardia harenae]|uniref:nuclear transport factor 2 family protein n=1 Tax=Nocardia harenae TaxID=358707 RepID=UPI00082D468A|nr:nuclear transport factor 2 family protein [Nocardia harenae]
MAPDPALARDDLLAAVLASPAAVAAKDRAGWLALFTPEAVVEDPVGSRPHVGLAAIGRFHDTFIAPNTITFQPDADIVTGRTVLRDLAITIRMATGATVRVPMHLRYDLVWREDSWRIAQLAAHWEFAPMVRQLLGTGLPGLGAGTLLGGQLLRHLGPGGALGMLGAVRGVGGRGRARAERVLRAAADGAVAELAGVALELPTGRVRPGEFAAYLRGATVSKVLAAGRTVTASVRLGDRPAVAIAEFAGPRVTKLRLVAEE